MKKKKYKFQVEPCLENLAAVHLFNVVVLAMVRLLDAGNLVRYDDCSVWWLFGADWFSLDI